jgi:hypothetical protein
MGAADRLEGQAWRRTTPRRIGGQVRPDAAAGVRRQDPGSNPRTERMPSGSRPLTGSPARVHRAGRSRPTDAVPCRVKPAGAVACDLTKPNKIDHLLAPIRDLVGDGTRAQMVARRAAPAHRSRLQHRPDLLQRIGNRAVRAPPNERERRRPARRERGSAASSWTWPDPFGPRNPVITLGSTQKCRSLTARCSPHWLLGLCISITRRNVQQVRAAIARCRRIGRGFRPCLVRPPHILTRTLQM